MIEGRPWAEYGKSGKPITKNQLARRLKRFKIEPDSVRIGGKTPKGYYKHQFQEAWDRYLSPTPQESPPETQHRNNPDEMGTSVTFQNATEKTVLRFENGEKPSSNGHCCGVADGNLGLPAEGNAVETENAICGHCGQPGELQEVYYGDASAWLHRDCQAAWMTDCDLKGIPPFLDRRAELTT